MWIPQKENNTFRKTELHSDEKETKAEEATEEKAV